MRGTTPEVVMLVDFIESHSAIFERLSMCNWEPLMWAFVPAFVCTRLWLFNKM